MGLLQNGESVKQSSKIKREKSLIRVANVVSMEFENAQALQDFAARYNEVAPIHYPQAEILLFVKTDDQSGLVISIYPSEEAREAGNQQRNQDAKTTEMAPLMKEIFRVKGDVMVKHIMPAPEDK